MSVLTDESAEVSAIATQKIEGALRWFDHIKGYGFITPKHGEKDIMLYHEVLREYGQSRIKSGSLVTCEVMESPKGFMATKILKILEHADETAQEFVNEHQHDHHHEVKLDKDQLTVAIVKWYDERKGYGFCIAHDDSGDIMLSRHILRRYGLRALFPGDKIYVRVTDTEKGRLADYVEF